MKRRNPLPLKGGGSAVWRRWLLRELGIPVRIGRPRNRTPWMSPLTRELACRAWR